MTPEERFWAKVDKSGECWLWLASLRHGYGQFYLDGKVHPAHRAAWFFEHGALPTQGQVVCHACDTPRCVRPAHLFLGSQADNLRDMRAKGRGHKGEHNPKGSLHPDAILTEAKVFEIRAFAASGMSKVSIARHFGVARTTVSSIVWRRTWRHI